MRGIMRLGKSASFITCAEAAGTREARQLRPGYIVRTTKKKSRAFLITYVEERRLMLMPDLEMSTVEIRGRALTYGEPIDFEIDARSHLYVDRVISDRDEFKSACNELSALYEDALELAAEHEAESAVRE